MVTTRTVLGSWFLPALPASPLITWRRGRGGENDSAFSESGIMNRSHQSENSWIYSISNTLSFTLHGVGDGWKSRSARLRLHVQRGGQDGRLREIHSVSMRFEVERYPGVVVETRTPHAAPSSVPARQHRGQLPPGTRLPIRGPRMTFNVGGNMPACTPDVIPS